MMRKACIPSYPLKIVRGAAMAAIDRTAIEGRGIPGLTLMESAGYGVAERLLASYPPDWLHQAVILCGKGSNGGDGFVVARCLAQAGHAPLVALMGRADELKGDARINYERAARLGIHIFECNSAGDLDTHLASLPTRLYVDALLGTGSQGAPRGMIAEAIHFLNTRVGCAAIAAIDIPSGVDADTGAVEGVAVRADVVYTMGLPKVGHVLPPGLDYGRSLEVLDIGFPLDLLLGAESEAELLSPFRVNPWLPARALSAHKGSEGHLLLIAGSRGMTGAALMSARSSVLAGAGLVTAVCPRSLLPIYAQGVWEMLTLPVAETDQGSIAESAFDSISESLPRCTAVVLGPGMGRHPSTTALVRRVVEEVELPLLLDGDGLSAVTPELLARRPFPWVATPHPGEMARLFQVTSREVQSDRWGYARRLSENTSGVVVLKGPKTVIAVRGETLFVNPTGNPAMASGGMGDVLAGLIGAFLARRMEPGRAAAVGVYLHGLAADLLVWDSGAEAVSATQVLSFIPNAVHRLRLEAAGTTSSRSTDLSPWGICEPISG